MVHTTFLDVEIPCPLCVFSRLYVFSSEIGHAPILHRNHIQSEDIITSIHDSLHCEDEHLHI